MKLNFSYGGKLRGQLEKYSSVTHDAMLLYSTSEELHKLFFQNDEHSLMVGRFKSLPNIPDSSLTTIDDIYSNMVVPLEIGDLESKEVIERTLKSHFRKMNGEFPLADDFTIAVARCIPNFILEKASNNPRVALFDNRAGEVFTYLKLPEKNDYQHILSP